MPSDRFGQIRIKPEKEKISPDTQESNIPVHVDVPSTTDAGKKKSQGRKQPKRSGGRRWEYNLRSSRAILWFAVPLFLVLLNGVGSYFLVPSLVKGPLAKNLSETLGRPVSADRVVFSPFTLRVIMQAVIVGPVTGDTSRQNLFECASFKCRIDFLSLFRKQVVCHEVKLDGVALNLVRLRIGSFTIADAAHFFTLIKASHKTR